LKSRIAFVFSTLFLIFAISSHFRIMSSFITTRGFIDRATISFCFYLFSMILTVIIFVLLCSKPIRIHFNLSILP
jgi:hypothetical protein